MLNKEKEIYNYKELLDCCKSYINDNISYRVVQSSNTDEFEVIVKKVVDAVVQEHYYNNRTFDLLSLFDWFGIETIIEAEIYDRKKYRCIREALESLLPYYLERDIWYQLKGHKIYKTLEIEVL